MTEIVLAVICGIFIGAFVTVMICAHFITDEDAESEKRGVWIFKDRAYHLTRISRASAHND